MDVTPRRVGRYRSRGQDKLADAGCAVRRAGFYRAGADQVIATSQAYERKAPSLFGIESVKEIAPGAEADDQAGE